MIMIDNQTIDTREKLEADCEKLIGNIQERIFSGRDAGALRCQLKELLDRQVAITERHWMEIVGASANANIELKRQIDELQAKLDECESEAWQALIKVDARWASAQVEAEERAKRCTLLEMLARDMWREMITCPDYASSPCMTNSICERIRNLDIEV